MRGKVFYYQMVVFYWVSAPHIVTYSDILEECTASIVRIIELFQMDNEVILRKKCTILYNQTFLPP
jgi:hypothetical protein